MALAAAAANRPKGVRKDASAAITDQLGEKHHEFVLSVCESLSVSVCVCIFFPKYVRGFFLKVVVFWFLCGGETSLRGMNE